MLAIYATLALVTLLTLRFPGLVDLPISLLVALGVVMLGVSAFVGGAVARWLAGTSVRTGRMGLACALAFLVSGLWTYAPGRGWMFTYSQEAIAPSGGRAQMVWGPTIAIWLVGAVLLAGSAWVGDSWAARKRGARRL